MTSDDGRVTFLRKELRGSRLRCLILTSGSLEQVGHRLTRLVEPYAEIDAQRDTWMPRGFLEPKESTLEENDKLLPPGMCRELTNWWLAKPRGATKPTWDIASTAMIGSVLCLPYGVAVLHFGYMGGNSKRTLEERWSETRPNNLL